MALAHGAAKDFLKETVGDCFDDVLTHCEPGVRAFLRVDHLRKPDAEAQILEHLKPDAPRVTVTHAINQ